MNIIFFYIVAALAVLSALGVVMFRNPVHSAMSLVAAMFLLAIGYMGLGAHLVAALQIVVYAGAVMVLFLFVIMLLNLGEDAARPNKPAIRGLAFLAALVLGGLSAMLIRGSDWASRASAEVSDQFGTTAELARVMFTDYVVAFELTSILLLVAVVGAVVLARRDTA